MRMDLPKIEIDSETGKPIFTTLQEANLLNPIEKLVQNSLLGDAPKNIYFGGVEHPDYFVSTWLDVHYDDVESNSPKRKFTPTYIAQDEHDAVVIGSLDGDMQIHELRVGASFTLDLKKYHALLPRSLAAKYLASPRTEAWRGLISNLVHKDLKNYGSPVLAWHQETVP